MGMGKVSFQSYGKGPCYGWSRCQKNRVAMLVVLRIVLWPAASLSKIERGKTALRAKTVEHSNKTPFFGLKDDANRESVTTEIFAESFALDSLGHLRSDAGGWATSLVSPSASRV